ncbi:hypothetical protein HAZT_HAZT009432 [Hyalella azteca]|uniref:Uncharacterized protein n=1 Tax=Hyalella azteca TaxID=294128 RepID=A0A6A0HC94_HYAAZ|nr:hypothetical protein HAZT_HAZT009432 [Hyalella azteca]
MYAWEGRVIGE